MTSPDTLPSHEDDSTEHQLLLERLGGLFVDLTASRITVSPRGVMRCIRDVVIDEPRLSAHGRHLRITRVVSGSGETTSNEQYQLIVGGSQSALPDISFYYDKTHGCAVTRVGEELPVEPSHYQVMCSLLENVVPDPRKTCE